jgi:hypothetical protein
MALSLLWYQEQHAVFVGIPCSENSKKIFWYWSFGHYYYFIIKVMAYFFGWRNSHSPSHLAFDKAMPGIQVYGGHIGTG